MNAAQKIMWNILEKKSATAEIETVEVMEISKLIAIDFHDWQKKDQAECLADMSTEDYFDKYLKSRK